MADRFRTGLDAGDAVIPYGRQSIDDSDIAAVTAVLKGDWLTQGPTVEAFEAAIAERVDARHVVAFANGTAALHAAAAASGLGTGDLVATTPLTFVASANCARYVGATPTFVDIDPETLNLDVEALPPCDGLVAVHFAGLPVQLQRLRNRPRVVIEDAAHAIGAATPDGPVGNCAHSDMCVFSFHPVKTITSGEGGAVTTNSSTLAERLMRFRNHGMVREPGRPRFEYDVPATGYNYRLSDIHAALGLSQLHKLDSFIARRTALADRYRAELAGLDLRLPPDAPPGWRHGYHLFAIRVSDRDRVYEELRALGIGAQVHYTPIHHFTGFRSLAPKPLPHADAAGAEVLSIPLFPSLRDDEQDQVVAALRTIVGGQR
jgi:perosamine synthetase